MKLLAPACSVLALAAVFASGAESDAPASADARDLARLALKVAREGRMQDAASLAARSLEARGAEDPALRDALLRNAAVAALQSGDAAAAETFFSSFSGPDASTGLGFVKFRQAEKASAEFAAATNSTLRSAAAARRLAAAEAAASAFRDALAQTPDSPAARTNLATVLEVVPRFRDEARSAALEARFEGKEPAELLDTLVSSSRAVYADAARAAAISGPSRISALEKLAQRQRDLSEIWAPLSDRVLESMRSATTNADDIASLARSIREAADFSASAADALDNARGPDALEAMRRGESAASGLRAMLALPIPLLRYALDSQSNALERAVSPDRVRTPVEEQAAAISLFGVFADRVEPWLDALEKNDPQATPGAIGGSETPLSEEDRKLVLELCAETRGTHSLLSMGLDPSLSVLPESQIPNATQSASNMGKLLALLTKTQQQQQDQQQQQQQDQQQQQQDQQQDQNQQAQQQDQNQQARQQQDPNNRQEQDQRQQQDQNPQQETPEQDADEREADEKEEEAQPAAESDEKPDDAEELMRRMLELEKRRAEEKRRRRGSLPPRVGERDW